MTHSPPAGWAPALVRIIVYGFAFLMDLVLSSVLLVIVWRVRDLHQPPTVAGGLFAAWAGVYFLTSLQVGRMVRPRNAAWLLVGSCIGVILISLGFMQWPGLGGLYAMTTLLGVAVAFFFTPFQIFMKLVDEGQNKSVARSSGLYVFAWSSGFAMGPFIAGLLWRFGWNTCHLFNTAAAALIIAGVLLLKHHAETGSRAPAVDPAPAAEPRGGPYATEPPAGLPDLAWLAWIFSGLGCMIATMIRSQFPYAASSHGVSEPAQGTILLLFSGTQAVVGLLLGWTRRWMYEAWPIVAFGTAGVVGLAFFAAGRSVPLYALGAMSYGVYAGSFYFYLAYHALILPARRARYVSINEAVVGLVGIIGPVLGGLAAQHVSLHAPYALSAGLVGSAIIVHAALQSRQRPAG